MADEAGAPEGPKYKLFPKGSTEAREAGSRNFSLSGRAEYVTTTGDEPLPSDTYEGSFSEGCRQGKGIYVFKSTGDVYEGAYEENLKHDFGKMTYTKFYGTPEPPDFMNPEPTPEMKIAAKNPQRGPATYLGQFTAGKRGCAEAEKVDPKRSDGTFTYVNGDMYCGQWMEGKKHGEGTYTYAKDETKLTGEWEKGKMAVGRWLFPNGTFYSGEFRFNKPFGKGVWVFKNGNQVTGEYFQEKAEQEAADPPPWVGLDPKVQSYFKHDTATIVHGGTMFKNEPPSLPISHPL